MGNLFNPEGKLMHYGTKLAYLLWLQALTILCSLPVFTIGAAFSAMHKLLLQIYRNTESHITQTFFKSFWQNLRQATVLWLIYIAYFALLVLDYLLAIQSTESLLRISVYFLPILAIAGYLSLMWIFPLQSRYNNSVLQTIKLSFTLICFRPLITIIMAVLSVIPFALLTLTLYSFPYVVFFGVTVPGLLQTILYSRVFDHLEGTNWRKQQTEELLDS